MVLSVNGDSPREPSEYMEIDAIELCMARSGADFDTVVRILEIREDFFVTMGLGEEHAASWTFNPDATRRRYAELFPQEYIAQRTVYPDFELMFVLLESRLDPFMVATILLTEREYAAKVGRRYPDDPIWYRGFLARRLGEVIERVEGMQKAARARGARRRLKRQQARRNVDRASHLATSSENHGSI